VHTYITNITLNYKRVSYTEVTYNNYFINSLNIYINKTLVPSFYILFIYPFIIKRPYYNSGLFSNKSINLINTGL